MSKMSEVIYDRNDRYRKYKRRTDSYCGNCGKYGHLYRNCSEPIISFGVTLVHVSFFDKPFVDEVREFMSDDTNALPLTYQDDGIKFQSHHDIRPFCLFKNKIRFLMIQRRHTLGYVEFIRGRYHVENVDGIIFLFKQMTPEEITKIGESPFDILWNELWGDEKARQAHQNEFSYSQNKFNRLKNRDDTNSGLNLDFYVREVKPKWDSPEWGFPKGRRNKYENNLECALREFHEETGFNKVEYTLIQSIKPIEEKFYGTNGVCYKHIYYPAFSLTNRHVALDDSIQTEEIGGIRWCTYEEALQLIRPHHEERKIILTRLYMRFMNNIISLYNKNHGAQQVSV